MAGLIIIAGLGTAMVLWNRDKIIASMLASVKESTGAEISARSTAITFRSGLVVVLDEPKLVVRGREVVKLETLRVVLGWRALFFNRGLPLRALILERPQLVVAAQEFVPSETAWRHPGERTLDELLGQLEWLSAATGRIEVVDAVVRDDRGELVCDDLDAVAYKMRSTWNRWRAGFNASVARQPVEGLKVSGDITIGYSGPESADAIANGKLWFWEAPVDLLDSPRIKPSGRLQGAFEINVTRDGSARGNAQFDVHRLIVRGEAVGATLDLGDFTLRASFKATARQYQLTNLTLADPNRQVIGGHLTIDEPYSPNPQVAIALSGFNIDVAKAKQRIAAANDVPREIKDALVALESGTVTIESASLAATLAKLRSAQPELLVRDLVVNATLANIAMQPPANTRLPAVQQLSARAAYERGVLSIAQCSARLGSSTVQALRAKANFKGGDGGIEYDVTAGGDAVLEELFPAIQRELAVLKIRESDRFKSLRGRMRFDVQAAGRLREGGAEAPQRYSLRLEPRSARLELKEPPSAIEVTSGKFYLDSDLLRVEQIVATDQRGT
ncbi:MAG: hypothetical protein ACREQF_08660, partial [Candidatus Binataceae bacterium]